MIRLIPIIGGYEQNLAWFAAWTSYLSYYAGDVLGLLFAAAIEAGDAQGEAVLQVLLASAKGEHEIGAMGRHITRALLVANRTEGWVLSENLLIAAQRQEGLRQTILETIDEAHPQAFRRMVRLLIDKDLTRFSATIRAVDVWLGMGWESINQKIVKEILGQILQFLEHPSAKLEALDSDEAEKVYLALWTLGFENAIAAIPQAVKLLQHPQVEHRFVAVHFLAQLGLAEAQIALLPALEDGDLRVTTRALTVFQYGVEEKVKQTDLFERLEQILPNFPEKAKVLTPLVWEWMKLEASQPSVARALMENLGERSPKRLIPYLSLLEPYQRANVASQLAAVTPWDEEIRQTLFVLLGDASRWARESVLEILKNCQISLEETVLVEKLLTRKSGDLRRGILQLLLNQNDEIAIASATRLLDSKNALQRQAGLELLREMVQQERYSEQCRARAEEYQAKNAKRTEEEYQLLEVILQVNRQEPTLEDALGLINPSDLTLPVAPYLLKKRIFATQAAKACLQSLDNLIHEHRHAPIVVETWQGTQEDLLGNVTWNFPHPDTRQPLEEDKKRLPLLEIWENWEKSRSKALKDEDGLEIVRAMVSLLSGNDYHLGWNLSGEKELTWYKQVRQVLLSELPELRYPNVVRTLCSWLIRLYPPTGVADFCSMQWHRLFCYSPNLKLLSLPTFLMLVGESARRCLDGCS